MASLQDFIESIRQVEGIGNFLLMRDDGRILAHEVAQPDSFSSLMALAGLGSRSIQQTMGFSRLQYFMLGRESRENVLVFPLGPYLLGVQQSATASGPEVVGRILRLLQKIRVQA